MSSADPGRMNGIFDEARRLMTICNACRYCEGLCAVFPAMEMRRTFADGDLAYLANLCHACGACYVDCQYAPPHEFNVNVPKTFAKLRGDSYRLFAWPRRFGFLLRLNGVFTAVIAALSVAGFVIGFVATNHPGELTKVYEGPGAFYALMPHNSMALLFGAAFLYAILSLAIEVRRFLSAIQEQPPKAIRLQALWRGAANAARLRNLEGGGAGCFNGGEEPSAYLKFYHHLTFYGFLLCFASTCVATLYHYVCRWEAPYAWYSAPVMLGAAGGIGILIGSAGLFAQKLQRAPYLADENSFGMDAAFIAMLFFTSLSGLALLLLRGTPAMGTLLALHLGVVFALFITMPYGKFVHGLYRYAALVRYARERGTMRPNLPS